MHHDGSFDKEDLCEADVDGIAANPSAFDYWMYKDPKKLLALLEPRRKESQLLTNRYVLAALASREHEIIRRILDEKPPGESVSSGYEILLEGEMGRYEKIRPLEVSPESVDVLEIEEACYANHAIGTACLELGCEVEARGGLRLAFTLAHMLKMENRVQLLKIERLRCSTIFGKPSTAALRAIQFEPMPLIRSQWLQLTLAESLMTQGRYREALMQLQLPGMDKQADDLREFLHFLIGLPLQARAPFGAYSAIAHAGVSGDVGHLTNIQGVLEMDYAALLEAILMLRRSSSAQTAVRILGHRDFRPADQMTWRAILLLGAVARGAHIYSVATLADPDQGFTSRISATLSNLASHQELLALIRQQDPALYLLLHMGPSIQGLTGQDFGSIGVLRGQVMDYGGRELPVPGRTGVVAVLKCMGLPHDEITRSEKGRFRESTRIPGPVVNLGEIYRACVNLRDASLSLGHRNEAAGWEEARQRVWEAMTPGVHEAAAPYLG